MLASGSLVGGRFRVLGNFAPVAGGIAVVQDQTSGQPCWLIQIALSASAPQLSQTLERHGRFGLGVPGLARPVASGVDADSGYVVFAAPPAGSVADIPPSAWTLAR